MNIKNQDNLRGIGFILLVILCLFFLVKTYNEFKGPVSANERNVIQVTGEGKTFAVPDVATFSFSIQAESKVVADAQKTVSDTSDKAMSFLKSTMKIDEKNIQTTGYSIYPQYDYPVPRTDGQSNRPQLIGYNVSETVSVKLHDIGKSGQVLSGLGALNVTNLSGPSFTIDDPQKPQSEARSKAIADAKSKAEKLADDLGVSLVRIVDYSESGNPGLIYYSKAYPAGVATSNVSDQSITPGQNEVDSQVTVTYEIR